MAQSSITVEQFFKEHAAALQMRLLSGEVNLKRIIREPTVNRPGLALAGFTDRFTVCEQIGRVYYAAVF